MTGGQGHPEYLRLLDELRTLHINKSGGYGTGDDAFANFSILAAAADQPRYLYPLHRDIEKATRALSLHAQGRRGELEEEFLDKASLMLCAAAMLREDYKVVPLHPRSSRGPDKQRGPGTEGPAA